MSNQELIQIPKWQLDKIDDTLRIAQRILGGEDPSGTAFGRSTKRARAWIENAIEGNYDKPLNSNYY